MKCEQSRNPHHDGICECGKWGEEEEAKAAKWHAKQNSVDWEVRKRESDKRIAELNEKTNKPIKELEDLWSTDTSQGPPPPWSND